MKSLKQFPDAAVLAWPRIVIHTEKTFCFNGPASVIHILDDLQQLLFGGRTVPEKIEVPRRTRCFASDGPEQEDPFQQNVLRVLPLAEPLAEAFDVVVLEGFVERTIRLASLSRHAEIRSFGSHSERATSEARRESKNLSKSCGNACSVACRKENRFCHLSERFLDFAPLC
jgi:hypothetical protein